MDNSILSHYSYHFIFLDNIKLNLDYFQVKFSFLVRILSRQEGGSLVAKKPKSQ